MEETLRNEFPAKVKVAAFTRSNGKCESCGVRLSPGNLAYDHIIPASLDGEGGDNSINNIQVLCRNCHSAKTPHDVKRIAKAKRVQRKHIGAEFRRQGFRGWRRFDKSIVWKD